MVGRIPSPQRRFDPSRGGHAPGHLREEFADLLERYVALKVGDPDEKAVVDKLYPLAGRLWNCSDQLPSLVSSDAEELTHWLEKPPATYSQAARAVRSHVERHRPATTSRSPLAT